MDRSSGFTDLGTLGGNFAHASAVNDRGEVTGASTPAEGVAMAFVWNRRSGMQSLGLADARGDAINEHGNVAGYVNTPAGQRPFMVRRRGR